jgi:SAM-dependent methyltransferase
MITQTPDRPSINAYRRRILKMLRPLLAPHVPFARALDYGSGDGLFARLFEDEQIARDIVPVDVQPRKRCHVDPVIYDGRQLPFDDRSFDLVYAMDVLHHCDDPRASLRDLARCSANFVLLKDHTYQRPLGRLTLGVLDEIGNRRFGIPCRYHYQRGWQWSEWLAEEGFVLEHMCHPAGCHAGPIGRWLNRLEFIALWRRETK